MKLVLVFLLESTTALRVWRLVKIIAVIFIQGVTTGLLANALQSQWRLTVITYLIVAMFYCLAKFFMDDD